MGLETWLSISEPQLLLKRTLIWVQLPIWQLTTVCNSIYRGFYPPLWPLSVFQYTWFIYIYRSKHSHTNIIKIILKLYHLKSAIFLYYVHIFQKIFPCLSALAWTSNTLLNKRRDNGHLCLTDNRGNVFSFPTLCDSASRFGIHSLNYVVMHSFYTQFIQVLFHEGVLNLIKYYICIYWDANMIFILHSVHMRHYILLIYICWIILKFLE